MTKLSSLLSLVLLLSVNSVSASIIAVVDSGNDFLHKDLVAKAWVNPLEIPGNDRDEDKNGYPDDINGWNFAEGNNILMDYSYANTNTEDARKFFDVQLKSFLGTITQADRDWAKEKFKDPAFVANLQKFGNWMHGTHVTGITVKNSPEARAVGIKLIPTEVKVPGKKDVETVLADKGGIKDVLLKAALTALAQQQTKVYVEIGAYINGSKADVMNGSFGTSYEAISGVIKTIYKTFFKKDPTEEEVKLYTDHFFTVNLEETKKFLSAAPNTLFVFAAGNEGSDNDVVPSSPTNVQAENKISVAATLGDQSLANFSCYGAKNVEVAAPGVGILSTIPMNNYLAVSGTSQAAPYVANIAGRIKDVNPKLGFREIKKIIMETVDVKSWLAGKVKTSGLVNRDRAIRAAELSRTLDLSQAIAGSKRDVLAKSENDKAMEPRYFQVPKEFIQSLPSPIAFKF
ncbi:MAG: S8 family serine peptidase [Bacteriovorax sp.]|nr:S8 family serine peptidase [Bacteriovorax sp.]